MGDSGIIDGQDLQGTLRGGRTPVYHHEKVAEVADTEASLGTEREHGYHGAGTLPWIYGHVCLWQFHHHYLAG